MKAMLLEKAGQPLVEKEVEIPHPAEGQLLVKVKSCGVCRTDLHIVDGDLQDGKTPLIPGHEIIGEVVEVPKSTNHFKVGDKVGIPWLAYTCGRCHFCLSNRENLCENAEFTGYTINGGYAEYTVAYADYCLAIPPRYYHPRYTPLLCAGFIGYRSYRKCLPDQIRSLGLYGFGASAHLLSQVALDDGKKVYAFTREGDVAGQEFARKLGCHWAGASTELPPQKLDAAIVFAPVGSLMIAALKATNKGGRVVSAGIHMSPIPEFEYRLLWEERSLHSVANLERRDGHEFMKAASKADIQTTVREYGLSEANEALADLRNGNLQGAAVLTL